MYEVYKQNKHGFRSFLETTLAAQNYKVIGDLTHLFRKVGVDV